MSKFESTFSGQIEAAVRGKKAEETRRLRQLAEQAQVRQARQAAINSSQRETENISRALQADVLKIMYSDARETAVILKMMNVAANLRFVT